MRGNRGRNFGIPGLLQALAFLCLVALPARAQSPSGTPRQSRGAVKGHTQESAAFEDIAKRASAAREADRAEEAIRLYKQALGLKPSWAEGWWYLGTLYYDADRYGEALPAFRDLVGLRPQMGPAWALLGLCEFEAKDYKNSLIHLEKSRAFGLSGNEELVNVTRYHAGLLYILKGDFEQATRLLTSLIERGVASGNVKYALGLAMLRVPLLPNQVDPSKDAQVQEAGEIANLVALSNFDRADEAFRQFVKDYPNTSFVHYAYGEILEGLSRYDEAAREFRAEIKVTPESAMPYMQLAFIGLRMRRPQEAEPLAEQAVKLAPRSFAAHYLLGRTRLELGKVQPAIQELETARQYGPFSPEVRYNLSRAYAKANRKAEAERERAEFARLNALLQREQGQGSAQSYRTSGDRGKLEPQEVHLPAESPPK